MTLNVDSWLANSLGKEARISHFNCKIFCGKTDDLKPAIKSKIKKIYGDIYLNDADYIIIFKGEALQASDAISKLFALTDRALGKNANSLTRGDFKTIKVKSTEDHTSDEDVENDDINTETQPNDTDSVDFVFVKITLN